jgi:hypothetical protein
MDPPGPELDGEQYIQGPEPGRLHSEEVEGHDPMSLGPEELAPRGTDPAWSRTETLSAQDRPDGGGGYSDAELHQLATDPEVAPPGVLSGHSHDELDGFPIERRPARSAAAIRPLAPNELSVPPEQGSRAGPDAARRGEPDPAEGGRSS